MGRSGTRKLMEATALTMDVLLERLLEKKSTWEGKVQCKYCNRKHEMQ
jgi:hypothetical protein